MRGVGHPGLPPRSRWIARSDGWPQASCRSPSPATRGRPGAVSGSPVCPAGQSITWIAGKHRINDDGRRLQGDRHWTTPAASAGHLTPRCCIASTFHGRSPPDAPYLLHEAIAVGSRALPGRRHRAAATADRERSPGACGCRRRRGKRREARQTGPKEMRTVLRDGARSRVANRSMRRRSTCTARGLRAARTELLDSNICSTYT